MIVEEVKDLKKQSQDEANGNDEGQSNDENIVKTTIITPHTCTYYRGQRDVFATSKRQRAISPQAIKTMDKGKKKVGNIEQQGKVRRSKRLKKTTQGPEFINLDSDEQDEEMTTKMLLLEKYAQIKEWEEDFKRARRIIQYYKNEHKCFRKINRGIAL